MLNLSESDRNRLISAEWQTNTEKLNENKRIIGEIDTIIKEDKGFSR